MRGILCLREVLLQHNLQYKYLLNSDHSRKITLKVIIVIINYITEVGIFGIFLVGIRYFSVFVIPTSVSVSVF